MPIVLNCPCGQKMRVQDEHQGSRIRCPACQRELRVPNVEPSGPDIFISYSSKDKMTADALCFTLESHRLRCWMAPRDILPGADWGASIIEAIEQCRLMVLVYSSNSNESPQVKREIERAVAKGLTIVPLRIEAVPPSRSMEYFISSQHWLDALTAPVEKHFHLLANRLRNLLADEPIPEAPPAPAAPPSAVRTRFSLNQRVLLWAGAGVLGLLIAVFLIKQVFFGGATKPEVANSESKTAKAENGDTKSLKKPPELARAPDYSKIQPTRQDEFDKSDSGFPPKGVPGQSRGYKDGRYFMRTPPNGVFVRGPWTVPDCACEAVGRVVGGSDSLWGIELNNYVRQRGVGIYINGRGDLRLHPTFTQGQGRFAGPHRNDIAHAAIKTGNEFNTLLVIARGRRLEVYVNGVAVCEPLTVDFDYLPAKLDLFARTQSNAEAQFERITVWSQETAVAEAKKPEATPTKIKPEEKKTALISDYSSLATGTWQRVFTDAKDLVEARRSPSGKGAPPELTDGVLKLNNAGATVPVLQARDVIVCTRVKKMDPGLFRNVMLGLRHTKRETGPHDLYAVFFNGGNWFGVGKLVNGKWTDLKHARTPKSYDDYFELALAMVGDRLTAYVDGVRILEVSDSTFPGKGGIRLSASNCRAFFTDVEVMILDKDASAN